MGAYGPLPAASIERVSQDMTLSEAEMFRQCMRAMDSIFMEREVKSEAAKRPLTPKLAQIILGADRG